MEREKRAREDVRDGRSGKQGRQPTGANAGFRRFTPQRVVRLAIQLVFFALAPQVFSMAFAGARYVLACIGKLEAIEPTSFVVLLLATCAYTVAFGRFFCGYACAFGTLGDVLYEAGRGVCTVLGIQRRQLGENAQNKLRYVKYAVLVLLLVGSLAGGSSIIGAASPWTAFGRIVNFQVAAMGIVGAVLLLLAAVGMVWQERFFCEYLCPLGALFSLLPVLPFSNHRRNLDVCVGCGRCQKRCPVGIYPPGEGAQMGECLACGACEGVCPKACIAQASAKQLEELLARDEGREVRHRADPVRLQAAQVARPVVLAVVLLVVFWLVGAVNYLPAIG